MIRRPPRSTQSRSSAASDVYKRQGLRSGEIADELNISRDTATWLLTRSETSRGPVPKDIYVNWSEIGQNAERLRFISLALADMILETGNPDVVVGVALSGLPLATLVAEEIEAELAVFLPKKQKGSENESFTGSFLSLIHISEPTR